MVPIILKKSNVALKAPTTSDLDWGELGINYTDGKLYYKKQSDGNTSGVIDYFISSTAATGINNGALTLVATGGNTNSAVAVTTGTGFSANSSQNAEYTITVGPALTALSSIMTGAGTGILKKTGADTYTLDTSNYITSAVTSFSGGTTGLTPSTTSTGAITLGGILSVAAGGTGAATAAAALSALGGYPATNPNNYTANTGTVTSVGGTGTVAGLSLSGTVTTTGNLTLSGTLSAPVSSISDSTTVGRNLVKLPNPDAVTFLRVNADNTISALNAADFRTAIGSGTGGGAGTVTSVSGTGTVAGLSLSGTVTTTGNLTLSGTLSAPVSSISDSTTVGRNLVTLTNPSSVRFLRVNADNSVSALNATDFRTAIEASSGNSVQLVASAPLLLDTSGPTPILSISAATTSSSGTMSATDKTKLNSLSLTNLTLGVVTPTAVPISNSTGTGVTLPAATTNFAGVMTANDKARLDAIAVTGTAPIVSSGGWTPAISLANGYGDTKNPYLSKTANFVLAAPNGSDGVPGFRSLVPIDIPSLDASKITSGTLDAARIPAFDASKITSGTIDAARLPSYVDDVIEVVNLSSFPGTGETGKIYVALDTNKTYRWSGSAYVYITSGAVDSVAGKTGVVTLTKTDVGLDNVENKSSATIRSEITSSNVTTALGYTPYNATNPNGYITSSGNAATATTLQTTRTINNINFNGSTNITVPRLAVIDDRTIAPADVSTGYVTAAFTAWGNATAAPYADALVFRTYTDASGGNDNMLTLRKDALGMRVWQQTYDSSAAFTSYKDVAWTDGTNATGTWPISITGNAATVTAITSSQVTAGLGYTPVNKAGDTITGNIGIGISAAPLGTESLQRSIQIVNGGGAIFAAPNGIGIVQNVGFNIDTTGYYQLAGPASAYIQTNGTHIWFSFPSAATAGAAFEGQTVQATLGTEFNSLVPLQQNGNQVLHAANYNSYSPTLTGVGASGTWGISITGTAAIGTSQVTTTNIANNAVTVPVGVTATNTVSIGSTETTLSSVSVDTGGQPVLIMFSCTVTSVSNGATPPTFSNHRVKLKRGTALLIESEYNSVNGVITFSYVDSSPGTGTITYNLVGQSSSGSSNYSTRSISLLGLKR